MKKIVYQTDSFGYYIGETYAFNDLIPHDTVEIAPLEDKKGFVQHWNGKVWEYVENHTGETGYVNNELFEIKEYGPYPYGWSKEYIKSLEELRQEKLQKTEALYAELSASKITINNIEFPKKYEIINEWLTFAQFKNDPNLSIPDKAVMMDSLGNNMNSFSTPMIMGTMWQLTQAIMTLRADHFTTVNAINNAKTIEELNSINI